MGVERENETRIRVVRRRPVVTPPQRVAQPRPRRADVCMAVMAIDAPGAENTVNKAFRTRSADVIDDFMAAILLQRLADASTDVGQGLVPTHRFPLAIPALPDALHWREDAIRVVDLIDGGRSLRTVFPAAARMGGIAFELANSAGLFVDVGQQAASALAVETSRRDE